MPENAAVGRLLFLGGLAYNTKCKHFRYKYNFSRETRTIHSLMHTNSHPTSCVCFFHYEDCEHMCVARKMQNAILFSQREILHFNNASETKSYIRFHASPKLRDIRVHVHE